MFKNIIFLICLLFFNLNNLHAEINKNAEFIFKIQLAKKPTTRPQTVAYIPGEKKYYIADGGLAARGSSYEPPMSKSLVHTYDEKGNYIESTRPGFDNRSIYYNEKSFKLETITYNVSTAAVTAAAAVGELTVHPLPPPPPEPLAAAVILPWASTVISAEV